MNRVVVRLAVGLAVLGLIAMVRGSLSAQGVAPASQDVLPALLVEVRGLRAAMEQMASAGARVQLAMGRLQLQEQRINTSIRRLDEIRAAIPGAEAIADLKRGEIRGWEAQFRLEPPDDRDRAEEMLKQARGVAAARAADVLRLQGEEASLVQLIATEQARWTDINERMEELENSLVRK